MTHGPDLQDLAAAPTFNDAFRADLARLFAWRRDVRRFRPDPVAEDVLESLLDLAHLSPSVGNSQPWRWVRVHSEPARMRVRENFRLCNAEALSSYAGERAECYAALKLEGLQTAPVQFAVFSERAASQGHRLGRLTMPETLEYSVVAAVSSFLRAVGLGVGWVSILDPEAIRAALDCPATWRLVAYLCVGWPIEDHLDPELARHGWQARTGSGRSVLRR